MGCWITEKIDGTNAQILINDRTDDATTMDQLIQAGSRNRWVYATDNARDDNFGFARWVKDNRDLLVRLGPGRHFGEWYGNGVGRGYGLDVKRFALFDRRRWQPEELTARGLAAIGVEVVPMLASCGLDSLNATMAHVESDLLTNGSRAVLGFAQPEGFVVQIQEGPNFKVVFPTTQPKQREEHAGS